MSNRHLALVVLDGRSVSLNWDKVIRIEYKPTKWEDVTHVLPEGSAQSLIALGMAKADDQGVRIL